MRVLGMRNENCNNYKCVAFIRLIIDFQAERIRGKKVVKGKNFCQTRL